MRNMQGPNMAMIFFLFVFVFVGTSSNFRAALAGDLRQEFDLVFGDQRAKILDEGRLLTLSLDQASGSGFASKKEYLFARIDMQLKLVIGDSAGTVTAYYLSSQGAYHDEIDFEFLGNITGEPYIVHTNVYTLGTGGKEQQFHLWFDPTTTFHTYSIAWSPELILFLVDNVPIRVFNNGERFGIPFPNKQPMKLYSTIWNADQWATRGGLVKTNWSNSPFTAYYRNFKADACIPSVTSPCTSNPKTAMLNRASQTQGLDPESRRLLRWVQKYYMIYNYCTDFWRFPQVRPMECYH